MLPPSSKLKTPSLDGFLDYFNQILKEQIEISIMKTNLDIEKE